jgi:subfamily B ATP-binding cassette protein MsbA
MKTFFRLLSFAKPYNRFILPYVTFYVLAVLLGVVNFSLLIPLFDVLFMKSAIPLENPEPVFAWRADYLKDLFYYHFYERLRSEGAMPTLWFVCLIIVASVSLTNLFRFLGTMSVNSVRGRLIENLREALFKRFLSLDLAYFSNEKKGELMSRIVNDVNQVEVTVSHGLMAVFKGPMTVLVYFGALLVISVKLTVFTILYLPLAGGLIAVITKKLRSQSKKSQNLIADVLVSIEEAFSGIKIIKATNAFPYIYEKFRKLNSDYTRLLISIGNKSDAASPVSESMGALAIAGILLYGGSLVLDNSPDLNGSAFIAYIVIFSQILPAIKEITNALGQLQRGIVAGERIFEVLDTETKIQNGANAVKVEHFESEICFRNVSFAYEEGKNVLSDVSFTVKKGQVVALVGASGSGKSTIADLLMRFYDVSEGGIFIDGVNIKDCDLNSLRKMMTVVTQEAILFNDSIEKNIAFGLQNYTKEEVINAAKIANAHSFICETEENYATNIGDRGVKLSGGQRQRLSIARAVMRNPSILILDEATSALDSESEKTVQDALYKLMQNRTSVVIAHRLSTIKNADKIIVLDKGKIVESGSHDELMQIENGFYKRLTALQNILS